MPDRSLELYLAQHYYSGPKSEAILNKYGDDGRKKKKKKKHTEGGDALTIKDDSSVWFGEEQEGDEDVAPEAVEVKEAPAPAATTKSQGWKNVREGEAVLPPTEAPPSAPREEQDTPAPPPIKAGLMSGAQLRAQREAREAAERAEREREAAEAAEAPPQETVYRDASGRKIDVEEEEARIREEHLRAEAKKKEREQWNQGLVQRREREAQRSELEAVQKEGVARHANDARMNDVLKERTRWDDPAAAFLTRRSGPRVTRPQYTGPPPPPNRFGIKPGYRWDGVDRGNGFESKLFLKINSSQRLQSEFQAWSAEDM